MTDYQQDQFSSNFKSSEIQALKNTYNQRLDSIFLNLQQLLDRVQQDDLLSAMKNDPISQQFVQLRVKEIFQEGILQEQEEYFQRLAEENAEFKSLLVQYQDNLEILKSQIQILQDEKMKNSAKLELAEREKQDLKSKLERYRTNNDQNIKEKQFHFLQEFDSFKHDNSLIVQDLQNQLKTKQITIEDQDKQILKYNQNIQNCTKQIKDQQEELIDNKQKLQKQQTEIELNIQEINSKNFEISQLQNQIFAAKEQVAFEVGEKLELAAKNDELNEQIKLSYENEQLNVDGFQQVKNEYKAKIKQYKKKLLDYKSKINFYENEIEVSKRNTDENKFLYEKSFENFQADLKRVKDEWSDQVQQKEQTHKQQLQDANSKFQNQFQTLQTQYQTILDQKIQEIQMDAQAQVQKAQNQSKEIQKLVEIKISNQEKDQLSKQKHYAVLEERLAQNQQTHEKELQQKDEIFQYELNKKLKKVQQEKQSEIENLMNKISSLEYQILEATSIKAKTETQLQHEKQVSSELAEKVNKLRGDSIELEQSKKNLIQNLDEQSQNLTQLKELTEDQQMEIKRIEEENQNLENAMASQSIKLSQTQNELEKQTSQRRNEILIIKQNAESEVQKESNKFRDVSQQLEQLQMENIKLKHEKDTLGKQLEENQNLSKQQIREMKNSIAKSKQEDSERFKQETIQHTETKNVLIRTDTLNQQLKNYIIELESRLNINQEQMKSLEKQVKSYTKGEKEILSQLQRSKAQNQELQKRIEIQHSTSIEKKNRIIKQFTSRLNNIRTQLLSTKSNLLSQITIQDKEYSVKLQELMLLIKEKTESIRRGYNHKIIVQEEICQKESNLKIQQIQMKHQNQINQLQQDHENKIKFYQQENESLQQQNITFQSQQQNSDETAKNLQEKLIQMEQSENALIVSNNELNAQIESQQQQFESLRIDVKYETDKIKQESDNLLEMTYSELDKRHQKEKESYTKELQNLKYQYQTQMEQIEINHNQNLENQQNEIETRLINDIQALDSYYKQEIKDILLKFKEIQSKQKQNFQEFEQSIEVVAQNAMADKEELIQLRIDKDQEIDILSEHLKNLSKELINRTKYCEELSKDKELARSQMRDLKRQLDIKDLQLSQKLKEVIMSKTDKDRELQDLKALIIQIPDRQVSFTSEQQQMTHQVGNFMQNSQNQEDNELSVSQLKNMNY